MSNKYVEESLQMLQHDAMTQKSNGGRELKTRLLTPTVLLVSLLVVLPGLLPAHATGDFTLTAPGSITCVDGRPSCGYTVTVTSLNGFTGTVSLSITAYPAGTTTTISPTSVTLTSGGSATATVKIVPPAGGSVTVQGTSGSLQHSVTTHLTLVT